MKKSTITAISDGADKWWHRLDEDKPLTKNEKIKLQNYLHIVNQILKEILT